MALVFSSIDDKRMIKIDDNVIDAISEFRQLKKHDTEAGGILIGRESLDTNNLIIEFKTVPFEKDVRRKYKFKRRDENHYRYFEEIHNENDGIYAYVGEWHTHPEKRPMYSSIDIKNWRKISVDCGQLEKSFFHIIVGTVYLHVWEYNYSINKYEAYKVY